MKYEYIDHTADLKVRAYGRTLEEAFANSALGGFNFLTDTSKIEKSIKKNISLSAARIESLLYDFLEELLFFLDTEGFLLSEIESMRINEHEGKFFLSCIVLGDNYKNKDYDVKGDIKAITYSDMSIKKSGEVFVIEVVFDI